MFGSRRDKADIEARRVLALARASDLERLESSHRRVEERVDALQRDTNGMGARLDTRIDAVGEALSKMQEQNSREHERVMERLDVMDESVGEKVEIVETQVKDLTVKVAVEVGKMRNAAETVEAQKRFFSDFLSGEFLTRYRVVVLIVVLVILVILGGSLLPSIVHVVTSLGI